MKKPMGIYIHVPFCEKKCDYCDFYSLAKKDDGDFDDYVESLLKEIDLYKDILATRDVTTVFFGGGTPSLLGTDRLLRIMEKLRPYFGEAKEITMEGNPESVLHLDVAALIDAGFNRFSMGVQSASDKLLNIMGRIHDVKTAEDAFYHLREGGAKNINLDFISSVPEESMEDVEASLAMIEKLNPEHVSLYSLIVEPGTAFDRRYGKSVEEREEADRIHVHAYEGGLAAMSYRQYEISNFEKGGHPCAHNLNYWHLGEYLGLGPAASGHLCGRRYRNEQNLSSYKETLREGRAPIEEEEVLSPMDQDNEYTMLGLRLNDGIPFDAILPSGQRFMDMHKEAIKKNVNDGLLAITNGRVALTNKGRDLANRVEVDFFRL
ncbi:radical SAM family heme chaperone HemW [Aedoeadaptatus pacaensis]|uniref:radical SAM family heme chaperone HemW n=1 Tax=Aedoeadaptatus pacaensis TaxID=1776390 RepID=UPI0008388723|nr:radical SAM family heme chaperone HemW [Peptoniphilus pacaensis]